MSTSFGFPVIVQNGSTTAFNQDAALATDFENVNIDFPALSGDTVLDFFRRFKKINWR